MAINIYEPQKFRSQGIEDLATTETLVITDGKVTIKNVAATESLTIQGNNFNEVENKGIKWSDGRKAKGLVYKQGAIRSDMSFDLIEDQDYRINETSVLSFTELGSTVTKSNLKTVGTLKSLKVAGNSELGDFVYVNGDINRVGINTDSPRLALGLKENGVEVAIGSSKAETASIGTITSSHLDIITDNTPRITIYRHGEVRVHGKLSADEITTERSSLLVFKESEGITNYGKGIMWASTKGLNKQFVLHANPDRLWTTENIALAQEKVFMINEKTVLSENTLGASVIESSLIKLGVLKELQVAGDAAISRRLSANQIEVGRFVINENSLEVKDIFEIKRNGITDFKVGSSIVIGNASNVNRPVSIYGSLAVGVAEPEEGTSLTVEGPVKLDGKKFQVSNEIPKDGQYNKGDIVWNNNPTPGNYIGWVCVTPGTPGNWVAFGLIASR